MNSNFDQFLERCKNETSVLHRNVLESSFERVRPEGLIVECGVHGGRTINTIAQTFPDRVIHGFDSFEGLPEAWTRGDTNAFAAGFFSTQGILPLVRDNVFLHKGWFSDTLAIFKHEHNDESIALLHIDCDLYSSTKSIFQELQGLFVTGTVLVFDELINYPGYKDHECRAFFEFLQEGNFEVSWLGRFGDMNLEPDRDNGAHFASVSCILHKKDIAVPPS